jgi:ABC-type transport system involved in multi-copper enzyme maturation permease subunit
MMSVFLWATPALSSELEGRSWVYLAVRPYGPIAVLIGKYIVSVSWAIPVGVVSATLSVLVFATKDPMHLIAVQCGLVVLSCLAYSALFLLIGVIAPKKSMVAGVIYTIVFEVAFALIPAAVNMLTVQYRLRCILVRWMEFDEVIANRNPVFLSYFGEESSWWHMGVLLGMTLSYLITAGIILRYREFTASIETET